MPSASLPNEIVVWEILVLLAPKHLLRCRSVCRAWCRVTRIRDFLLAHHGRQPSLPLLYSDDRHFVGVRNRKTPVVHHHNLLAFDHRAATDDQQLHAVAQLGEGIYIQASCDGLLVLSKNCTDGSSPRLSICNPATREHAPLGLPWDFNTLAMYSHCPTGEYRLLLQRMTNKIGDLGPQDKFGCYVFALGSDQPSRYIGWSEMALWHFKEPVQVRDSLHWYPVYYRSQTKQSMCESKHVLVFDTIAESFRQMRAPIVPTHSDIFEMDGTLGIHSCDYAMEDIYIWVLQNYEDEVWNLKHQIKLPVAKIKSEFVDRGDLWDFHVVSLDGGVLLLVMVDGCLLHVNNDGKLVNSLYRQRRGLCMSGCQLKQTLVQHTFFPALEGYGINASPFIRPVE